MTIYVHSSQHYSTLCLRNCKRCNVSQIGNKKVCQNNVFLLELIMGSYVLTGKGYFQIKSNGKPDWVQMKNRIEKNLYSLPLRHWGSVAPSGYRSLSVPTIFFYLCRESSYRTGHGLVEHSQFIVARNNIIIKARSPR